MHSYFHLLCPCLPTFALSLPPSASSPLLSPFLRISSNSNSVASDLDVVNLGTAKRRFCQERTTLDTGIIASSSGLPVSLKASGVAVSTSQASESAINLLRRGTLRRGDRLDEMVSRKRRIASWKSESS